MGRRAKASRRRRIITISLGRSGLPSSLPVSEACRAWHGVDTEIPSIIFYAFERGRKMHIFSIILILGECKYLSSNEQRHHVHVKLFL
mmetsp:Transcript_20877/g.50241  ORF Transcript_20877/g.50241 Transcript_20877/m.50241 type:complete len:88 (-) Transcript_20877:114-377(-)